MFRLFIFLAVTVIIVFTALAYANRHKTFSAKFKNIDGLPKGAPVTALGVMVGEVVRTKSIDDGVIVTIKITNKSFENLQKGSELTITSFRPGHGRILEIIPQNSDTSVDKSFVAMEPVTTESWLHAALDILDGLKIFSHAVIKHLTPENIHNVRTALKNATESLNKTRDKLSEYEANLIDVREKFSKGTEEAYELILRLKKPIESLNQIINNNGISDSHRNDLSEFVKNVQKISSDITSPDFLTNIKSKKIEILQDLNAVNTTLQTLDKKVLDSMLIQNIKDFNGHIAKLNSFYSNLNKKDLRKIVRESVEKTRKATEKLESKTSELIKNFKNE